MKFNKFDVLLVKLNYKFLISFIETCKPYMKNDDYMFYKTMIRKINFKQNLINIDKYIVFLTDTILKSTLKNMID